MSNRPRAKLLPSEVLKRFHLDGADVSVFCPKAQGIRPMYLIEFSSRRYILKRFNDGREAWGVRSEQDFCKKIISSGFTSILMPLDYARTSDGADAEEWLLYPFVSGDMLSDLGRDDIVRTSAQLLSSFHDACFSICPTALVEDERLLAWMDAGDPDGVQDLLRARRPQTIIPQITWIHGDFRSNNVIMSPEGPVLIDLEFRRIGNVLVDLASFYVFRISSGVMDVCSESMMTTFLSLYEGGRRIKIDGNYLNWVSGVFYRWIYVQLRILRPDLARQALFIAERFAGLVTA